MMADQDTDLEVDLAADATAATSTPPATNASTGREPSTPELSDDLARMQAVLDSIDTVPVEERVELFQQMNRDIAGCLAELDEL